MSSSHGKAPFVFNLSTQIQIKFCYQKPISSSRKTGSSWTIRSCNVGTSIEMTKIFMSSLSITTCKLVRIDLSSYSIDADSVVMVGDCSVSGLNAPKRFRQRIYCGRRVKNDFSSVKSKSHPMKRMMSAIADVYSYLSKLSFKNWMTSFSFHIVSRFVEITNSWDVSLLLFS